MHSHDDELLVLAEALGEVKTKTEKLEAEFSTQARPLEAATNALSATLSGIKALQFHVIDNNLGALSARVEEMRKAVDEQVGVIALELKKADESNAAKAGQEADALRSEIAGLQAQLGTLGAQFEAQLARVEFAAKEEAKKLQLIPGPAGEAGASLNPRGTFIDGQTYNRLDVVSWLGSSYIATVDGVTEKPSKTSTQWQVLASRGNGGGGTASLNDMLGAPSAGTIVGSEGSSYVRKTLVAGANIAISETPSTITITGTEGEISLEDGSAASPSLFFTNDPDTGIYRPGSNQVGISLGGSAQAVLTSTTFTVTPNLVVSGTGTSSIGGNATVAGTLRVATKVIDTSGGYLYGGSSNDPGTIGAFGDLSGNAILTISRATGNDATLGAGFGNLNLAAVSNVKTGNVFQVTNTTASSSTSTGALVVSGGVGVAGTLYVGSKGQFQSNDDAISLKYSTDGGSCLLAWKNTSGTTLWSIGGGIDTRQDELVFRRGSTTVLNLNNSNNATFAGTLTVSGAAGITGSDLTLGASGPSVKSTLSARAPRQGLVFDGTAGATVSATAPGSTDFTIGGWVRQNSSAVAGLIAGNAGSVALYILANGTLRVDRLGTGSTTASTGTVTAGKDCFVLYVRSGTTGTYYIDGIAAGTTSDSFNYSTAIGFIGGDTASSNVLNGKFAPFIYNRALSAAEVVALYEAGAPSGADYIPGGASNAIYTSNFTSGVDGWNIDSPNTRTSVDQNADGSGIPPSDDWLRVQRTVSTGVLYCYRASSSVVSGTKIRLTTSIFLPSGSPITYVSIGSTNGSVAAGTIAVVSLTAGATTSVDVSFTLTGSFVNIITSNSAGAEVSVVANTAFYFKTMAWSGFGLLLAPDAAQAGGGSVWYDTSGNAANITLPASGVSWNVPTSGKINNAFAITNTTASTSTSTGALVVSGGVGVAGALYAGGALESNATIRSTGSTAPASGAGVEVQYFSGVGKILSYNRGASSWQPLQLDGSYTSLGANNGNVLIGTTTDSANGKLQLATHTTSAGGIGFGTDTSLYRGAGGNLCLNDTGTNAAFSLCNGGTKRADFYAQGSTSALIIGPVTAGWSTVLMSGAGTTALTITSAQQVQVNATTASTSTSTGALVVSGGVGVAKEVYIGKTCKVGTGSDNEGYTNVFTNKAENTAGPFDITLPSDCVGVVFLNSHQGGVGRSFREIPFICFGGTVTLGTSRTTVLTADPVTSVAAAASSKITISLYAANTNCYWGIYVNKS